MSFNYSINSPQFYTENKITNVPNYSNNLEFNSYINNNNNQENQQFQIFQNNLMYIKFINLN